MLEKAARVCYILCAMMKIISGGFGMKRNKIRIFLYVLFIGIFCAAGIAYYKTQADYAADRAVYDGAADAYVTAAPEPESSQEPEPEPEPGPELAGPAPISVDFGELLAECPDVQGWIYCEGTEINYPVVQGKDNNQYLRHAYTGEYAVAGSIFVEAANAAGFADSNTVIYGHHMKDGSMFHCLSDWADQEFYESHKNMWLLTPAGDYRVDLFSGYITPAGSDAYAVFQGPSEHFDEYLDIAMDNSDFKADTTLERDARYVMLSTCDYTYKDARYVLHGKLVPCAE